MGSWRDRIYHTGSGVKAIQSILEKLKIRVHKLGLDNRELQLMVDSIFYPRRIMVQIGKDIVRDFDSDREYVEKLLSGYPVCSRVVELHATKGTCEYNCVMCLWSDKDMHTYRSQKMESDSLMSLDDWKRTLVAIKEFGAKTAVFSGGGEVLLNRNFFQLIELAHKIGLTTQLYTNGFNLYNLSGYEWEQILTMDKIRFSFHSPFEVQYSQIANITLASGALARVTGNLQELLQRRAATNSRVKIGIGFVIQPINFSQIEDMAHFAQEQGVDFLNIRRDEINVTDPLSTAEQDEVRRQLNVVRQGIIVQNYGSLAIDLSDNLTAFANGESYDIRRVAFCFSKYYRPAINPFGLWTPCDLKAEPMFCDPEYVIGDLHRESVEDILRNSQKQNIPANCANCMPSGQTGNAIFTKIINDYQSGIDFRDQPFFIES